LTVKQAGYSKEAFSLIEIMVAVGIMVIGLTAILASYANMFILGDLARDLSRATNAARARMEEVKQVEFDSLDALNATTFDLEGFNVADARGRVEVRNITGNSNLKEIRIVGCFRSRNRVVGEDANLNGALDTEISEDKNNNGRLDSPVELITLLAD